MPELTLRDVMTREFIGVSESDTVGGAVRLMREEGVQSGVVLRGHEPIGTLEAGDVLDVVANDGDVENTTVDEVMRRDPPSLAPDATLGDAASAMQTRDADLVLVEADDELLGVITARELAHYTWDRADAVESPSELMDGEPVDRTQTAAEGYSNQSICEACGSLSRDLVNVNGQLLCPDCREV